MSTQPILTDVTSPAVARLIQDLVALEGETEHPAGSNRSEFIDRIANEFGSPLGSPWCALTQGYVRKKNGLWLPTHDVGSCNEWVVQAKRAGKWSGVPVLGAAVIYTDHVRLTEGPYAGNLHALHMGGVVSLNPLQSIEGNTSAGHFDRNGGTVLLKTTDTARVYGYVLP